MAKKIEKGLESGGESLESGVRSLEEAPCLGRILSEEELIAEQEETARINAEAERRYKYSAYYQASLTGMLAYYGLENSDAATIDQLAHRMALHSLRSESTRVSSLSELEGA